MQLKLIVLTLVNLGFTLGDLGEDLRNAGITAYLPGDGEFSRLSKAYNTRYTFKPAAVTYPNSTADVSKIVKIAGGYGVRVVARSGGHSYIASGVGGKGGGLVVDMEWMKAISVSPSTQIATIETGNRLGNVAKGLSDAGRAIPHGTCPYVGIGGHASYGGFGYPSRLWGLTLDNIQAVNIVLANGSVIRATEDSNTDIFWASRGAAPSFGIVTSIEIKTYSLPDSSLIFFYQWKGLSAEKAAFALTQFQLYPQRTSLPSEIGLEITLGEGTKRGTVSFTLQGGYYGSDGRKGINKYMEPFLKSLQLTNPDVPLTVNGNGSYIDSVRVLAEPDGGLDMDEGDITDRFYARSVMVPEGAPLNQKACNEFMKYLGNEGFRPSDLDYWFVEASLWGGKNSNVNRVPLENTSFGRRDTLMTMQIYASSGGSPFPQNGFTLIDDATQKLVSAMPGDWNYGAYTNYLEDRSLGDWQRRYYGTHYQRLQAIKRQIDPNNMFSFPFSVVGA